ncbi:hypothetical protein [Roseovarius arcticus]|uniref:hypothetical protein n=1 Tax=Roseovarius arcticus TaxID=2547404 RepID=UPI00111012EF|nr:hypothetical protein [Roseovarius arcticus]
MRWLIGAFLLMFAAPLAAQDELRPALSADVVFTELTGAALVRPEPGKPFEVTVRIDNRLGTDPPAGLQLAGWFRPVEDNNLGCVEAARSFFATGRLPRGAIKLNGALIGVASEDGSFTIVDPEIDLASANLVGAARFDEAPATLVADIAGRRFIAALTERGEVLEIAVPSAALRVLAEGLARPVAIHPVRGGDVWVVESGRGSLSRIGADGSLTVVATDVRHMLPSPPGDTLAVSGPGGAALRDAATGRMLIEVSGPADHAVALADFDETFALASLAAGTVAIRYTDAPDTPVMIELPAPATRLAAGPEGRWILVYDPRKAGDMMLIDVGRGAVIQSIATPGPISEIAFTDRAAYLMTSDQSRIGVLDLAAIRSDRPTQLREVMLGQARKKPLEHGGYLAPLWPQPGMIAVHAESYTGFIVHDYSMMGDAPPMSAIRLRGGVPRLVTGFDRSFREVLPGVFQTTAMLPIAGEYELVTTTGIGSLSFCAGLPAMEGAGAGDLSAPGHMIAERIDPTHVRLSFRGEDGVPVTDARFRVLVTGLATPWRNTVVLTSDAAGQATDALAVPQGGPVVIAAQGRDGHSFHPLVMETP